MATPARRRRYLVQSTRNGSVIRNDIVLAKNGVEAIGMLPAPEPGGLFTTERRARRFTPKPVTERARRALISSLEKWDGIVKGTHADAGANNCQLCWEFAKGPDCHGCPVRILTGEPQCRRTPYYDYRNASMFNLKHSALWQASLMASFLRGLLPAKKIKKEARE